MLLSIIQIDIGTHKIFRLYFGYISAIFYSEKTTDFRARPIDIFSIYILGTFLKVPDRLKTVDLVIFSLEILRLKFSVKLVVFSCNRSRNRWFRSSFLEIWKIHNHILYEGKNLLRVENKENPNLRPSIENRRFISFCSLLRIIFEISPSTNQSIAGVNAKNVSRY